MAYLSIPVPYDKKSALFVQYCLVEQKCKIHTTGGGEIICSFQSYLNWFIGNRRK
jgi:hypothetical protein